MTKRVAIIGVPMDLGGSKPGTNGGPAAVRRAELLKGLAELGLEAVDRGDVRVPARPRRAGGARKRHLDEVAGVCRSLCEEVSAALKAGQFPVVLGGDHSLAVGSVAGAARHFAARKKALGLIWVDAHGDINTPSSSPTGNLHGMPLAHLLGLGDRRLASVGGAGPKVAARNVCLVGIRELDAGERRHIRESGVNIFTMKDIDKHGMAHVVEQAIECASDHAAGVHVSFDIDAVDPAIAQGTGTPSRGGLTYREAHLLMEMLADSELLASLDMVEVNPLEDVRNQTAVVASELVQSALGKRIY